jgi:hypothetical protein
VEFLDSIEELAQHVRIEADSTTSQEKIKQMVLRSIIKDYFWGKAGRNLKENVNTVKKFYKISYVGFGDPCKHLDKEILIEFDEERKRKSQQSGLPSE